MAKINNEKHKTKEVELLCSTGKSVLTSLHNFNLKKRLDDTEYFLIVKAVINGIKTQAVQLNLSIEKTNCLEKKMIDYSRNLYIKLCLSHGEEDIKLASQKGSNYFDYVYEYGKHPR